MGSVCRNAGRGACRPREVRRVVGLASLGLLGMAKDDAGLLPPCLSPILHSMCIPMQCRACAVRERACMRARASPAEIWILAEMP